MQTTIVPTDTPYSSELTLRVAKKLMEEFDFIRCEQAGKSVAGHEIYALALGKGERSLFVNASHHANEWITTPLSLRYLYDYAHAVVEKEKLDGIDAAALFENTTLYVMPLVDPDGVDLVNGFFRGPLRENAGYIAENYPSIPFPDGWKANVSGTDLNLNYPAGWTKARRVKYAAGYVSPAPRDFVGFAPLSAPESRAVYEFTLKNDFRMILALHTQGKLIYWKYDNYEPEHSREIGERLARVSGYSLEVTPDYSSNAGYKDWFIKAYNRPGYTVECGSGTNPLPLTQLPDIYASIRPLITTALHAVSTIL